MQTDYLDCQSRGKLLRDLVVKGDLQEAVVGSFLFLAMNNQVEANKQKINQILASYYNLESDIEDKKAIIVREGPQNRLPPHSPSNWSGKELKFYKIETERCTNIDEFIVLENMDQHAKDFVEKYKDLSYLDMGFKKAVKESMDDFTRPLYFVFTQMKIESHVDNLMSILFKGVLPPEHFYVFYHYPFSFQIGGDETKSIPDLAVFYVPKELIGVIVVEDKAQGAKDLKPEDAEAQAIAEAIAVCQQENWIENYPIYFIRSIGYNLTFYKAIFSKEFLEDVKLGNERKTITKVRKLFKDDGLNSDGYSLLHPKEREQICQAIYSIAIGIQKTWK